MMLIRKLIRNLNRREKVRRIDRNVFLQELFVYRKCLTIFFTTCRRKVATLLYEGKTSILYKTDGIIKHCGT